MDINILYDAQRLFPTGPPFSAQLQDPEEIAPTYDDHMEHSALKNSNTNRTLAQPAGNAHFALGSSRPAIPSEAIKTAATGGSENTNMAAFSAESRRLVDLYLPEDTAERRLRFCALFDAAQAQVRGVEETDIVSAFLLCEEETKGIAFLKAKAYLIDMGFGSDQVVDALTKSNFDADAALDRLVSK